MRHALNLETLARSLRVKVCPHCPQRAAGSGHVGADVPLPCEATCPIFVHLPTLKQAAEQADPLVGCRERILSNLMRRIREAEALAGGDPTRVPGRRNPESPLLGR